MEKEIYAALSQELNNQGISLLRDLVKALNTYSTAVKETAEELNSLVDDKSMVDEMNKLSFAVEIIENANTLGTIYPDISDALRDFSLVLIAEQLKTVLCKAIEIQRE